MTHSLTHSNLPPTTNMNPNSNPPSSYSNPPSYSNLSLAESALWLWVAGCLAFTADAVLYLLEGTTVSWHTLLYFMGSVTFLLGCTLWIIDLRIAQECVEGVRGVKGEECFHCATVKVIEDECEVEGEVEGESECVSV